MEIVFYSKMATKEDGIIIVVCVELEESQIFVQTRFSWSFLHL